MAGARHGMRELPRHGMAGEWHDMCDLVLRLFSRVALSIFVISGSGGLQGVGLSPEESVDNASCRVSWEHSFSKTGLIKLHKWPAVSQYRLTNSHCPFS
jgi:hypothetical protein